MEEYAGYRQLTDENGQPFSTYAEFCKAKQPWGLGYPPEVIDRIVKERGSAQAKAFEVENNFLQEQGRPSEALQKFSKVFQAYADEQPVNSANIAEVLNCSIRTARRWKKQWEDLGWLKPASHRGSSLVAEAGRTAVQERSENVTNVTLSDRSDSKRGNSADYLAQRIARDRPDIFEQMKAGEFETVWEAAIEAGVVTTPADISLPRNPKQAAEKLIQAFDVGQLRELHRLIGESLNPQSGMNTESPAKD